MCYCNGMETYELIRSGRKTLALEITRDCRVVVRAPRRLSQARIDDFVASHAGLIARTWNSSAAGCPGPLRPHPGGDRRPEGKGTAGPAAENRLLQ